MKNIKVNLKPTASVVKIGQGILSGCLKEILDEQPARKVFWITNQSLAELHKDTLQSLPNHVESAVHCIPDGEIHKNLASLDSIYSFLLEHKANRESLVLAFGGGVVGDVAGFAAASFMRGIDLVQIPTTLLAQVDSSIGGKTGVNHPLAKNSIGAFKQPLQSIIDTRFLKTLPKDQWIAGYAELFKHSLIADAQLFDKLNRLGFEQLYQNLDLIEDLIYTSCSIKAKVVEQDEKEQGLRATLNFGHTIGHFLETYSGYTQLLHGHAVIIGMDFACYWAWQNNKLTLKQFECIHTHLSSLKIQINLGKITFIDFKNIVSNDKKNKLHSLNFITLSNIGQAEIVSVTITKLFEAFSAYCASEYTFIF